MMTPEIKANVEFINALFNKGVEQCFKSALPYPSKLNYTKNKCPILAIDKNLVLINTNKELKSTN